MSSMLLLQQVIQGLTYLQKAVTGILLDGMKQWVHAYVAAYDNCQ